MRKKLLLILVALVLFSSVSNPALGGQDIQVTVDGQKLTFDVFPMMENNRVLVPMRKIFESLEADVNWNNSTRTITAVKGDTKVVLSVGSKTAHKNGQPINLDVPAKIVNGRTLVPIRFISEAFGADVMWRQDSRTVVIKTDTLPPQLDPPPLINSQDISRINFAGVDYPYFPLYPDNDEDRAKIELLVELYNKALSNLGEVVLTGDPYTTSIDMNQIRFILRSGKTYIMMFPNGEETTYIYNDQDMGHIVKDAKLGREIREQSQNYFVEEGHRISSREFRMGDKVSGKQERVKAETVHILIRPSRDNVTIPSAPEPYSTPDSILVATIPVKDGRFSYTFTLTPEIGKCLDGSPGKIGPGAWNLVYRGDYYGESYFLILPSQIPEPKAIVYDRGKVHIWSEKEGVRSETLKNPAVAPCIMGESQWGGCPTDVSLQFIRDFLDIPIAEVRPGQYRIGDPELGLTVSEGEKDALINGTRIQLDASPLRKLGDTMRIPWESLGYFFGYRCQWLGPEQVAMLCNMDEIPQEILQIVGKDDIGHKPGKKVTIMLDGVPLDLGGKDAFTDIASGKVMVPLRETARALGAELHGFQLNRYRELDEVFAEHNYGLPDLGPKVKSYIDVLLGRKMWRVYLTPQTEQNTFVSINELAMALGFTPVWDGQNYRVNLVKL